jgi:GrpB-like predicted nucleotidyltransferase (UPF0157 family)
MPEPVVVTAYDPVWPVRYEALRVRIAAALGDLRHDIHHVGSTAVPGLAAKPVIDLDVSLAEAADLPVAIARLATIGYAHEGDLGVPGREAFATPPGYSRHDHHLYVCQPGCVAHAEHLAFRDFLLANPAVAGTYGRLKHQLAAQHRDNRAAYTDGKAAFVREVLEKIGAARV